MSSYQINSESCRSIFASTIAHSEDAQAKTAMLSSKTAAIVTNCKTGPAAGIGTAVESLSNATLKPAMEWTSSHIAEAADLGGWAVDSYCEADQTMSMNSSNAAQESSSFATDFPGQD